MTKPRERFILTAHFRVQSLEKPVGSLNYSLTYVYYYVNISDDGYG